MQKKLSLVVVLGIILMAGIFYFKNPSQSTSNPVPPDSETNLSQTFEITQVIDFGEEKTTESSKISAQQGNSALDILQKSKTIEVKEFDFGKLVESIDNVKNGKDNKFWSYYVNSNEAQVGASEYKVQPNDEIRWEFKSYDE